MQVELVVKHKLRQTLNAKISTEAKDPKLSATVGWEEVKRSDGNGDVAEESKSVSHSDEQPEFEVDTNGSLPVYTLDAHEEVFGENRGTLYLFGKYNFEKRYNQVQFVKIFHNARSCEPDIQSRLLFGLHPTICWNRESFRRRHFVFDRELYRMMRFC